MAAMNVEGSRTGTATIARSQRNQFLSAFRRNLIGRALGPTAVAADSRRSDQARSLEATDGVIERAAFDYQDFIPMTLQKQALHFIGVHGAFTEEAEDGELPTGRDAYLSLSSYSSYELYHMNYLCQAEICVRHS